MDNPRPGTSTALDPSIDDVLDPPDFDPDDPVQQIVDAQWMQNHRTMTVTVTVTNSDVKVTMTMMWRLNVRDGVWCAIMVCDELSLCG